MERIPSFPCLLFKPAPIPHTALFSGCLQTLNSQNVIKSQKTKPLSCITQQTHESTQCVRAAQHFSLKSHNALQEVPDHTIRDTELLRGTVLNRHCRENGPGRRMPFWTHRVTPTRSKYSREITPKRT